MSTSPDINTTTIRLQRIDDSVRELEKNVSAIKNDVSHLQSSATRSASTTKWIIGFLFILVMSGVGTWYSANSTLTSRLQSLDKNLVRIEERISGDRTKFLDLTRDIQTLSKWVLKLDAVTSATP